MEAHWLNVYTFLVNEDDSDEAQLFAYSYIKGRYAYHRMSTAAATRAPLPAAVVTRLAPSRPVRGWVELHWLMHALPVVVQMVSCAS